MAPGANHGLLVVMIAWLWLRRVLGVAAGGLSLGRFCAATGFEWHGSGCRRAPPSGSVLGEFHNRPLRVNDFFPRLDIGEAATRLSRPGPLPGKAFRFPCNAGASLARDAARSSGGILIMPGSSPA
jgi:hypothetical protein